MKQVKTCSKCGKMKSFSEFRKDARAKSGLRADCKICESARKRRYSQEHKEKIAIQGRKYRQRYAEERAEKAKKYRQKHKKEIAAKKKEYDRSPKAKATSKKYYQAHRKERLEQQKKYLQSPEGKVAHTKARHTRRAQKEGVLYEIFDPQDVFERDGWRCQHCHKKVQWLGKSPNHLLYPNLDHIVPLSKGGEHTKRNTQLLCRECNAKKYINDVGEQLRLFG